MDHDQRSTRIRHFNLWFEIIEFLYFIFYFQETEDGAVQGPFSSEEMARKQANDKLGPKSLARRVGAGDFNPTTRIDFDLYC